MALKFFGFSGWKGWALLGALVVVALLVYRYYTKRRVYDPSNSQQLSDYFDQLNPQLSDGVSDASNEQYDDEGQAYSDDSLWAGSPSS